MSEDEERRIVCPAYSKAVTVNVGATELAARGRMEASQLPLLRVFHLADAGDAMAQAELGDMYREGRGVPRDPAEAVNWYRKAVEQRNLDAIYCLALMYDEGDGIPRSGSEALRLFKLATDENWNPHDWDPDCFIYMWLRAAEMGDAQAQYLYGSFSVLQIEHGYTYDPIETHMWLSVAGRSGIDEAIHFRERLAARMSADQIAKAQRLAREWRPCSDRKCRP